jgi:hypothetical protein
LLAFLSVSLLQLVVLLTMFVLAIAVIGVTWFLVRKAGPKAPMPLPPDDCTPDLRLLDPTPDIQGEVKR